MHMSLHRDKHRHGSVRDEHGFTLIELLVSMLVATVITGAAFSFLIFTTEDVSHITARIGVDQTGRTMLNRIMAELHSGCLRPHAQPIEAGSTENTLIFVSEGGEATAIPTVEKHEIVFTKGTSTTEGTLIEKAYVSTGTKEEHGAFKYIFPTTATFSTRLLTGISKTTYGTETTPIFRYYRYYNEHDSPPAGDTTVPYGEIYPEPLSNPSSEAANVTKVTMSFTLAPEGKEAVSFNHDRPVALEDSALFRLEPSSETAGVANLPCEKS
jgi:prepilin-type N-terminal cleavage/methylation domain-containing protein